MFVSYLVVMSDVDVSFIFSYLMEKRNPISRSLFSLCPVFLLLCEILSNFVGTVANG